MIEYKKFEYFLSNISLIKDDKNIINNFTEYLINKGIVKSWLTKDKIVNTYITETFNNKDLVSILTKFTTFLKNNELLETDVFYKQYNGDFDSLINKFFDKSESFNESYNMLTLTIPFKETWVEKNINGEMLKVIQIDNKSFIIRKEQEKWFEDNIGKNIKFKYNKNADNIYIELPEILNENNISNINDGIYDGTIKGYDVSIDSIDSEFKTTTGLKNMYPIKCKVIVKDKSAIVYYKDGVLFTDDKTKEEYKSKYNNINNDELFIKYSNELNK